MQRLKMVGIRKRIDMKLYILIARLESHDYVIFTHTHTHVMTHTDRRCSLEYLVVIRIFRPLASCRCVRALCLLIVQQNDDINYPSKIVIFAEGNRIIYEEDDSI